MTMIATLLLAIAFVAILTNWIFDETDRVN